MIILTIRTDKPEAEIGLCNNDKKLAYEVWTAHRQLAETIHTRIHNLLASQKKDWNNIEGIVCFEGPGSFTGLRIGLTVGNALANSLHIPIVGSRGNEWIKYGTKELIAGKNDETVLPHYGAPVHITLPKE